MSPVPVDRSPHRSYQLINEGSYSRDAGISHIELWPIVLPVSDTLSFDQGANRKRKEHEYDCTGETSRHATVEICTWLFIAYFDEPRSARRARTLMILPFINVHLLRPPVPSSTCEWLPVLATAGSTLLKEFYFLGFLGYFVPYSGTPVDCT